ncbi:flagellar hook capping protein [Rhodanobacter thiooxydans]|uniref:Basal-body rod modification protein FlgD n=2 Tax=Rhodanobacter thiooxydans TaxID=416169 RepID=A0A154QHM2_9GAMM|nr:flagellar hook capping protein [Rhodanobacter thiooxydans LCS2]KZC23765.1 flagellar hook capping protein [Rhodanobacter thiooxydans]
MSGMNVSNVGASAGQAVSAGKDKTLSQADFLSLLTEQMRNQDPTKPMDSSQMVSQLAQISQVSATQDLQASFDDLSKSMQSNQILRASGMVGRTVVVPSAAGTLRDGALDGAVNVPDGGGQVLVKINDTHGNVLRTISLGAPPAGLARFHWDGMGDDGQALPAGTYGLAAQAGNTAVATYVSGKVTGVGMTGSDGVYLDVDGFGGALLSQVAQIN